MWDNPLFLIPIVCGPIFILAGLIMWKFPPKKINSLYGYRTQSSMHSIERWNYAQKFSAIELIKWGAFMSLTGILGIFFRISDLLGVILGLILLIVCCIVLMLRTESAIRNKFGEIAKKE